MGAQIPPSGKNPGSASIPKKTFIPNVLVAYIIIATARVGNRKNYIYENTAHIVFKCTACLCQDNIVVILTGLQPVCLVAIYSAPSVGWILHPRIEMYSTLNEGLSKS